MTDPRGHSHGAAEPVPTGCGGLPRGWRRCDTYLFGVDLFNRAFFWEAHEAWEAAWHVAGHDRPPGIFLQGLIQISAALLKRHCGVERGCARLAARGLAKLDRVAAAAGEGSAPAGGSYMGVELARWRSELAAFLDGSSADFPFLRLGRARVAARTGGAT